MICFNSDMFTLNMGWGVLIDYNIFISIKYVYSFIANKTNSIWAASHKKRLSEYKNTNSLNNTFLTAN